MYQALYRKYRPRGFDSVVGQDSIIKTLKNSIRNKSFSHAYMFFGPRGTGKTTVSKVFARAINCLEPVDGEACGKCKNCLYSAEKECVDIIEIDAASNNGVDEIRELKNKISLVPSELKYKAYIIDEVHMLSIGAFNALLKTLEEPPEHAVFILATTDPQKVPDTIISRCQSFSFKRISVDKLVKRLLYICAQESIDIDEEVLKEIAIASDGGMRDSIGLLDKLYSYSDKKIVLDDFYELNGMIIKSRLAKFSNEILSGNIAGVLSELNNFNDEGKNVIQIINQLLYYLRNVVVDYYINNIKCDYSIDSIQNLLNVINEKMFDIKKSGNPNIYIETLLIKYINDNGNSKNISREIIKMEKVVDKKNNLLENNVNIVVEEPSESIDVENKNSSNDMDNNNVLLHSNTQSKVKNIDEIIKVRVNNTLAVADKQILKDEILSMDLLKDYTFDQEIGYIVCTLLDSKIRAASSENIIISYEFDSIVEQNLIILDKIINVYNKITNSNKNIAIITDAEWEKVRNEYIKCIKNGGSYSVIDEPEEEFEEIIKDDIISNSAIELFGDIVEID